MGRESKRGLFSKSTFFVMTIILTVFAFTVEGSSFLENSNDTLKVWIYLKEDLQEKFLKPIEYPERTLKRLNKVGWKKNKSDYGPSEEIIKTIMDNVLEIRRYSRALKAFSAVISMEDYLKLKNLEFVDRIEPLRTFVKKRRIETLWFPEKDLQKISEEENFYGESYKQLNQLNIPTAQYLGLTGKGIRIALIDAGFRKDHRAFKKILDENRLIAEHDFIFNDGNVQNESTEDIQYNQSSHGTSVWSLIGGFVPDTLIGAAYGAEFLLAKTERNGSETRLEEDNYVAAIEWADSLGADIISTSLAYRDFDDGFCYDYSELDGRTAVTTIAANWAFERGILFVTAAGNDGSNPKFPDGGLYTPGDAFGALTVGAVDENGNIAGLSSHGPTADGRIKPDLCAMGVNNYVARDYSVDSYGTGGGTSYSTPLIAGAAALIFEKYPEWGPDAVIQQLKKNASKASRPDDFYGWGIPDVWEVIFGREIFNSPKIPIKISQIAVFPNPSSRRVVFYFEWGRTPLLITHKTQLQVFDLNGRTIWNREMLPGGEGFKETAFWDLKDSYGRKVPTGIYLVYLKIGKEEKIGKFLIIK